MAALKKYIVLFLLFSQTTTILCKKHCCDVIDTTSECGGNKISSKSVYVDIGIGSFGTFIHDSFFRPSWKKEGCGSHVQAAIIGGKTTDSGSDGLARRFGIRDQRCIEVVEDPALGSNDDIPTKCRIDSHHFNIQTESSNGFNAVGEFHSFICFCPRQSVVGALLSWQQGFCFDENNEAQWWFELNAPIVHVEQTMGFTETVINAGGGVLQEGTGDYEGIALDNAPRVANMTQAFKQKNWKYGKIDGCQDNTELANFEARLCRTIYLNDACPAFVYLGFAAPTTAERTAEYVFEPIIGQKHWALIWGAGFDPCLYDGEYGPQITLHLAYDARYWFKNCELRSFDIFDKSWGRYIEMYRSEEEALANLPTGGIEPDPRIFHPYTGTSGINLMTRCVGVTPGIHIKGTCALEFTKCNYNFEIGHTLYSHQAESITPNWQNGPIVKDISGNGITNHIRNIKERAACTGEEVSPTNGAVYKSNFIRECDVDWNSGAQEAILAHTIYGSLGYNFENGFCPGTVAFGAGFDFGIKDGGTSVMRRWSAFGKLALSF